MKLVITFDCYLKKQQENPDLLPDQDKEAVRINDWFEIDSCESWAGHWFVEIKGKGKWFIYKPYCRIEYG